MRQWMGVSKCYRKVLLCKIKKYAGCDFQMHDFPGGNYEQNRNTCQVLGGDLVTIKSQTENSIIGGN